MSENKLTGKDLFDHLFTELKEVNDTYIKYVFTTTATQVLIIGWFVTSDRSTKVIHELKDVGWLFYVIILVFVIAEAWISKMLCSLSQKTGQLIQETAFVPDKYFDFKIIKPRMAIGMWLAHLALYLLLAFMLFYLFSHDTPPQSNAPMKCMPCK